MLREEGSGDKHIEDLVQLENEDLTPLWHTLKDKIECMTEDFGVIRMECLPAKRNHWSAEEKGIFQLYVAKIWKVSWL